MLSALLVSLTLLVQDPQQPDASPNAVWFPEDAIILTVDEGYVTLSQFEERLLQIGRNVTVTTEEQMIGLRREVIRQLLDELAAQSAARTLEFSAEDLDIRLRDFLRERRDEAGTVGYGDELRRSGLDPLGELARQRRMLLGRQWIDRQTGDGGFGRQIADTYVRPGTLRAEYPRYRTSSRSSEVVLRQIVVEGSQVGSVELAREYLVQVREQILAGEEDMAALAATENADEGLARAQGLLPAVDVQAVSDPVLREFLLTQPEGSITAHQPIGARGATAGPLAPTIGWAIFRIERRIDGPEPPPFETVEAQEAIRRTLERANRELRTLRAYDRQNRYVLRWMHPALTNILGPEVGR
jgi:hypothetical protein